MAAELPDMRCRLVKLRHALDSIGLRCGNAPCIDIMAGGTRRLWKAVFPAGLRRLVARSDIRRQDGAQLFQKLRHDLVEH